MLGEGLSESSSFPRSVVKFSFIFFPDMLGTSASVIVRKLD